MKDLVCELKCDNDFVFDMSDKRVYVETEGEIDLVNLDGEIIIYHRFRVEGEYFRLPYHVSTRSSLKTGRFRALREIDGLHLHDM